MNYFDTKKMTIIDELRLRDINSSMVCYILGVKEMEVFKWEKGISPIPENHKRKLKKFLKTVKRSGNPW